MAVNTPYRFGRFELHPATRQLLADGGQVTLGARAFDLLLALVERRDRLVTKDELLQIAWSGLVVEENNLQVQVSALRKILGPQAIATIPGRGYRFAARLENDPRPATARPTEAPERRQAPRPWLVPSLSEGPRLAAVIFTDVVGYSARMHKDEAGTIALVNADFERMRSLCGQHAGETLNTMGDGLLLCFPSALQAVSCALQIQREFGARKATTPLETVLEHRIGVHLGDVFHLETGDVAGDGINIAARLESKAPPGGICLSQTVYDTVKGKLAMRATFVGSETLKNIGHPVQIWHVSPEESAAENAAANISDRRPAAAVASHAPDLSSIAVLPFTNMSDDKDTGYFADGVHEDLLTQLSFIGELKVVSRTSVMEYRETKKKIPQIASELGVRMLVEGSVRQASNHVRVSAQLIDAHSDHHLWAKSYDRELKDIFAIQSELATEIAKALMVKLTPKQRARILRRPTENLAAYDLFLRHVELSNRTAGILFPQSLAERIELLSQAVKLDSDFALAWARLGGEHARAMSFGVDRAPARLTLARQAIDRALELAPDDIEVQIEVGHFYLLGSSNYERATRSFDSVLHVAPNNVDARLGVAAIQRNQAQFADYHANLEWVIAVDSRNARALGNLARLLNVHRHFDQALTVQQQLIDVRPGNLAQEALYHLIEYRRTGNWESFDRWRVKLPHNSELSSRNVWFLDRARAVFRRDFDTVLRLVDTLAARGTWTQAQWSPFVIAIEKAIVLLAMGDKERALQIARTTLEQKDTLLRDEAFKVELFRFSSYFHAILGGREAALANHQRAVEIALADKNFLMGHVVSTDCWCLFALLGDRELALQELSRALKVPGTFPHEIQVELAGFALWDDRGFLAIVNDPANNAPLPIENLGMADTCA